MDQGITWYSASLILVNVILGVGLLDFPSLFKDAGGILPMCLISTVSMRELQYILSNMMYRKWNLLVRSQVRIVTYMAVFVCISEV